MSKAAWTIVVALAVTTGIVHAQESAESRGAQLLSPYKQELQEALRQGLSEGPVQAISACRVQAPEIAKALSKEGIHLGRTSHRLRNPANSSPAWVSPLLEAYAINSADRAPRVVSLPNERSGYVEPILLQALCLTCHGEALAPDVAARINELYPEDRAVDYRVGDLRGVFWVEFPAD